MSVFTTGLFQVVGEHLRTMLVFTLRTIRITNELEHGVQQIEKTSGCGLT